MKIQDRITIENFNRRKFIHLFKKSTDIGIISSKLFLTGKKQIAEINYKRITEILNNTLQRPLIFENNNIYLVLQEIQKYLDFLKEFGDSIKTTNVIESLNDRQIIFFQKQAELEKFLKDNFESPKPVVLHQ